MKRLPAWHPVEWVAVLAVSAAVVSTVLAARALRDREASYAARRDILEQVRAVASRDAALASAGKAWAAAAQTAPDLAAVAEHVAPGIFRVEAGPARSIGDDLQVLQATAIADAASLADTGRLIEFAENQPAPWRLQSAEMVAAGDGSGRVRLTFETVAKRGGGS